MQVKHLEIHSKFVRMIRMITLVALLVSLSSAGLSPAWAAPGDIIRVSVDSSGAQADAGSGRAAVSGDGRYVAFTSGASNLVSGDTNANSDVFLHDLQTGATERVSLADDESQANEGSDEPAISADGRYIAFISWANNLVAGDTNGIPDVFVRDRQIGATTRVSIDSSGGQAAGDESSDYSYLDISGDGRFVLFSTEIANLVSDDTNAVSDVFVHDMQTGTTERVSIASDGSQSNAGSYDASISSDGHMVAFSSGATNLVSGDTNGATDVFVRDRLTGTTSRVSVNSSGEEADHGGSDTAISGNGRFVTFSSSANNLLEEEMLANEDLFVHDLQTGSTTLVSVTPDGYEMVGWSEASSISADGRYVTFEFDDRGDGAPPRDIYVHDNLTGANKLVADGHDETSSTHLPDISADGHFVTFSSQANYFVSGDTNGVSDVFEREVIFGPDLSPTVVSVEPVCGSGCTYPTSDNVNFRVTFSEVVTGVGVDDFSLSMSGGVSGASITGVSNTKVKSGYIISVNTGTGDGNLRLNVLDDDSIIDQSLNPLGGAGAGNGNFNNGELFVIDKNIPSVTGIVRADPNPTTAGTVHFTVTFSEEVREVDPGDFILTSTGGISGATVSAVDGLKNSYTVTVNTGTGDGTLRLDLVDDDSIKDVIDNSLGGTGAGNGNFNTGEVYNFERSFPSVTGILRADPNPTTADTVNFTVLFSEEVTGVDGSDFTLTTTDAVSGASITGVTGSGNTYTVTVGTGSGNGTIRLDLIDNDSILDLDAHPLGNTGPGNGNFTAGEVYSINKIRIRPITTDFRSNGFNDGWVLESGEDTDQGGTKNSKAQTFLLGDNAQDAQYRAILHFPTAYLPNNAVILQAILIIKVQGLVGTDPFSTHGNILVDIRRGPFGSFGPFGISSLQVSDFQAPASQDAAGVIHNDPVGGWYWALLDSSSYQYINLTSVTQMRLRFQTDDNDDMGDDFLSFFSGDYPSITDRPHLLIEYYEGR